MVKFETVSELITRALEENTTISRVTLAQTALDMEKTEDQVYRRMASNLEEMKASLENGAAEGLRSTSGLVGGAAYKLKRMAESGGGFSGAFMADVIAGALAVSELNACMGKIVAAPTAGSSGILPACLAALQKHRGVPDEALVMGLFNASAIGMVIARNASIAGARGGCQAECGSSAAMAASAMVEILGGSPAQCGHAAAQALKSLMGLICDPVAGLVEEPCVIRNAGSAAVAVVAAELALAGVESVIPVDEVITAMDAVGRSLPEDLRETANGGLAATETGQAIARRLTPSRDPGKA